MTNFEINPQRKRKMFVVDNFYSDPFSVRDYALSLNYNADLRYYKGLRSENFYRPQELKDAFEYIIGEEIVNWDYHGFNGCFQITTAEDPQVYHCDMQRWAGVLYLTPNAPLTGGTRLHRHKETGLSNGDEPNINQAFSGGFFDSTKFDTVAEVSNVFNRLIIKDARHIHSAGTYFGNSKETGRLVQLFFFD